MNRKQRLPFVVPLGGFQRIDLLLVLDARGGNMGGKIAVAVPPFSRGIGTGGAKPAGADLDATTATFTLLYDLMANPAVVGAPLGCLERALYTFFNGCTIHGYHPLRNEIIYKKSPQTVLSRFTGFDALDVNERKIINENGLSTEEQYFFFASPLQWTIFPTPGRPGRGARAIVLDNRQRIY